MKLPQKDMVLLPFCYCLWEPFLQMSSLDVAKTKMLSNSLPNDKILGVSKLKAFADNKIDELLK